MKLETAVVITKGFCFLTIGLFTPLTVGLAQWANTGEWPSRIIWVIMGASCAVGGASQLLAFLSQSFGNYKAQMKVDAGGTVDVPSPTPSPNGVTPPALSSGQPAQPKAP